MANGDSETDLPDYRGCLNLLQAIYTLWWRDAQRSHQELVDLAEWTGQTIAAVRTARPSIFRSARKDDLLHDDN